ncbi:acyltransferase [Vibrio paucivorans]|uniref:Acyltransferase family protein n=1 Tax=Vibrio paucivorans TaxID=2829489 RepID=A0A9X3CEF0_9VIBR|nr:acyltransferase family protein [Vibrio paucivorans]MCW8334218.1 acyltransferase family protein [Vibrio paucivorans]
MFPKDKIASIELGRVIAMVAIIALHCQMFLTYFQYDGTPWFGYIFNQLTRFAVPLFFIISGFLIQPKLTQDPIGTLKSYSKPLIRIWLIWSVISLVMPFNLGVVAEHGYLAERTGYWNYLAQAPLNSLLEGGLVHLWFIPALVIAVAVLAYLVKWDKTFLIFPTSIALYYYGVFAGSYQIITDLDAPFFTRNGPFFATLMVAIGFTIRELELRWRATTALAVTFLGMAIHFIEAYYLHGFGQIFNMNDFLMGTALWATGCFMWLLAKPNLGNHPLVFTLAKRILPVYVSHLLIVIVMMNVSGILGVTAGLKDLIVFTGTLLITYALVVGLEKTPLKHLLFR